MLHLTSFQIAEAKRRLAPDGTIGHNRRVMREVQQNVCFWCVQSMGRTYGRWLHPLACTLDHLDERLDLDVINALEGLRLVAAHNKCNHARSIEQGRIRQRELLAQRFREIMAGVWKDDDNA